MSPRLETVLRRYIALAGQHEPAALGEEHGPPPDPRTLRDDLLQERKGNTRFLIVAAGALIGIYAVIVYLIILNRHDPKTILALCGSNFVALLLIVRWLRQLWLDKSLMDLLIHSADSLDPDALLRLVTGFYFSHASKSAPPSPAGTGAVTPVASASGT